MTKATNGEAAGTSTGIGAEPIGDFGDSTEKAETKVIGRVPGALGYGTLLSLTTTTLTARGRDADRRPSTTKERDRSCPCHDPLERYPISSSFGVTQGTRITTAVRTDLAPPIRRLRRVTSRLARFRGWHACTLVEEVANRSAPRAGSPIRRPIGTCAASARPPSRCRTR
jgi:hypothetical protein